MINGSIVAIITPMQAGVSPYTGLDNEALERLVEFHIEQGSDAIVSVGTTGESATLTEKEHCELIKHTVQIVNGRVPVIAGTGANSTSEAIELTKCAKKVGADACLLVTPYYNKPTQEGLYLHHRAIAKAVAVPQILYNVPGRTACDILPDTVVRLSNIDNIIGIKEASAELDRIATIKDGAGDDFILLSGDDATAKDFILKGGQGVISVTANIAPNLMSQMCKLALAGDEKGANFINVKLEGLHKELFTEPNPIPVKWAAHRLNLIKKGIRLPLTWMTKKIEPKLLEAMEQAGVI